MNGFLRDAWDACLLRFKPLEAYSYSPWISGLWLTLLGLTDSVANADVIALSGVAGIMFFVVLNWAAAIVQALWLSAWFKYIERKPLEFSVFPLVVVTSTPQMLAPLLMLTGKTLADSLSLVLMLYYMVVLIRALSVSAGKRVGVAAIAAIAFVPVFIILADGLTTVAESAGWVTFPPTAPVINSSETLP